MTRRRSRLGRLAAALLLAGLARPGVVAAQPSRWVLTWRDEFAGTRVDTTRWAMQLGNGFRSADGRTWYAGWGNDELQCYTSDPRNVHVAGGRLVITARREPTPDASRPDTAARCAYSSARLRTIAPDGRALFAQRYGRFAFRARLPEGRGLWPALWMLPARDTYGGWAASGEIDVMEARGQNPGEVLGTLHYGGSWPANVHTGETYRLPHGGRITDWHVYAVEWFPDRIQWLVDDSVYQVQRRWYSGPRADSAGTGAPFDQPFTLLINLAVGGGFLGPPDSTTPFPSTMDVDWVRVYRARRQPLAPTPSSTAATRSRRGGG